MSDILARNILTGMICEGCSFLSIEADDKLICLLLSLANGPFSESVAIPDEMTCDKWFERISYNDPVTRRLNEIRARRQNS